MDNLLPEWLKFLDERQQNEVALARIYASSFHHGTTGHNQLMLIAKLAEMLDRAEHDGAIITYPPQPPTS